MKAWLDEYFDDYHFALIDFLDDVNNALVFNHITYDEAMEIIFTEFMEELIE